MVGGGVFDAIVVGTGFGGAVTACRLAEAGYDVLVLERGRRYEKHDFPTYPSESLFSSDTDTDRAVAAVPDFSRWLWNRDYGIYDVKDLDGVVSVQAAGYGGGSLIYANVHLRPPRSIFEETWPEEYRNGALEHYFDLAAYMLRVAPVPQRLAKTLQLQRAATALNGSDAHWFRTPLAVNFDGPDGCDMRGRCWAGCDRRAKNTLDLNYLARAERAGADIRTLAEVTAIEKESDVFKVTYCDLLLRGDRRGRGKAEEEPSERARCVFLCAGAINTTELLLANAPLLGKRQQADLSKTPLGSSYFPNSDSLAAIFDCDEPQEADYGPTITSAVLHQAGATGNFSCSVDFRDGAAVGSEPRVGMKVQGKESGATGVLAHEPILDWGSWQDRDAAGVLVLGEVTKESKFQKGEVLDIGGGRATATTRSPFRVHEHWFLIQDGGYPSDLEPLAGIFRSPFWLRRNRFIEFAAAASRRRVAPLRPTAQHLRLDVLRDAVGGTARRVGSSGRLAGTTAGRNPPGATGGPIADPALPSNLLGKEFATFFPGWFTDAVLEEKNAFVDNAAAFALPMLGRLIDALAARLARQLDQETVGRFAGTLGGSIRPDDPRKEVFIRGMLRQALQVLGGSEAELATTSAKLILDPVPGTPEKLLDLIGNLALWALAYGETNGHTAIVLVMGRDLYRGRLSRHDNPRTGKWELRAQLPGRLLDTSGAVQERVLRVIARKAWSGELRTNPAWATLERRLTVHSQGGCPMGANNEESVTAPSGEVHGCSGLYVMDAAAFPTSVGVNPSATILAVAEYKIGEFIRTTDRLPKRPNWKPDSWEDAKKWADARRDDLDPLNPRIPRPPIPELALSVLGLKFEECMEGFFGDVTPNQQLRKGGPEEFLGRLNAFRRVEDEGIRQGAMINATLNATVSDLDRVISAGSAVEPGKISLGGNVTFDGTTFDVRGDSCLQMFVAPSAELTPLVRFFCYTLDLHPRDGSDIWTLNGVKVLRNDPGADVWLDTSTLYFEMVSGSRIRHGVLRLSLQGFLQKQLPSMDVTGTSDPMRRSWALVAFYKFFVRELFRIYAHRAETLTRLLGKAITSIHV